MASTALTDIAAELEVVIDRAARRFRAIADEDASKQAPGASAWSIKQVVGHLVDSAANNHQRFVRAQQSSGEFAFPRYQQDQWVQLQGHQDRPWAELIDLWLAYNRHLAHVIRRIPDAALLVRCRIGDDDPVTLRYLVEDYLVHLQHHLAQIG